METSNFEELKKQVIDHTSKLNEMVDSLTELQANVNKLSELKRKLPLLKSSDEIFNEIKTCFSEEEALNLLITAIDSYDNDYILYDRIDKIKKIISK
jgi:hypothetical protein